MIDYVIITSGPTVEPIDPVRFISNFSSGKTGYYIAEEAKKRGIKNIIFITGPSVHIPEDVTVIKVNTAQEMREKVFKHYEKSDLVIMAAAVSDYTSAKIYPEKIKKKEDSILLKLIKNPDILKEMGKNKGKRILIGFAAETENIFENAQEKLNEKNLDMVVLNEISESNVAFNVDENQVYFITRAGIKVNKKMDKKEIAELLWDEIWGLAK